MTIRSDFTTQSIALVNQARQRAGLTALSADPLLNQVAQRYSARMAAEGFYDHVDPQGRNVVDRINAVGYVARRSAENIARGQPDPVTVVQGWLNSPGHRANILDPAQTAIGAGYAFTPAPPYHHYWTHVFAAPDPAQGRNNATYPAEAVTLINQARRADGRAPLSADPALAAQAMRGLEQLTAAGASGFAQTAPTVLRAAATPVPPYRRAVALVGGGYATPEEAVDHWVKGRDGDTLLDAACRAVGVAYLRRARDTLRHYWLAIAAG